ncbi:MAG: hypothetical protein JSS07_01920 [Proteobacteria bacterium]|nr:hypothetical protein [Pseudomonadota bacterium]
MQVLNKTQINTVSGGLDASQSTYTTVLISQAIIGLAVQSGCKVWNASPQSMMVAQVLLPALNVLAYAGMSEFGNWYFKANTPKE